MKGLIRVMALTFLLGFISCDDNKKADAEMQEKIEAIEEIDSAVNDINDNIENDMKELQAALEELDSI